MARRKKLSQSMRWAVFARDNFRCRYCGAQAGSDGVELVVDHIVSIADGGDNRMDNLLSACQCCNSGKGAKSLARAPISESAVQAMSDRALSQIEYAEAQKAITEAIENERLARKIMLDLAVNAKCDAYGVESVGWDKREDSTIVNMIEQVGIEKVSEWYQSAANHGVPDYRAIKYVCGCRRNYLNSLEES